MRPFRFTSYDSTLERAGVVVAVAYLSLLAHLVVVIAGLFVIPLLLSLLDLVRPQVVFTPPEKNEPVALSIVEIPPPPPPPPPVVEEELALVPSPKVRSARRNKGRAAADARILTQKAGILSALQGSGESRAFASLLGSSDFQALDDDAFGGLLGGVSGGVEAGALGGFGTRGSGMGGGGTGEGSIGLGSIGTIGHGSGTGTGSGYGSGSGRMSSRRVKVSDVRVLAGELDEKLARRVLQRERYRLQPCVTQSVAATLTVTLDVDPEGAVSTVSSADGEAEARTCVAARLKHTRFPSGAGVRRVELRVHLRP